MRWVFWLFRLDIADRNLVDVLRVIFSKYADGAHEVDARFEAVVEVSGAAPTFAADDCKMNLARVNGVGFGGAYVDGVFR